jgi:23S rRNA (cytidine2498-2'-O)-methyltransferase
MMQPHGAADGRGFMMQPSFIFVTCQIGAERAVKAEVARQWPKFRFAYSRPGFLTFKLPEKVRYADDFDLDSVFTRAYSFSLGKVQGNDPTAMARQAWELLGDRAVRRIHVWARDAAAPGERGYEPGFTPGAFETHRLLWESQPKEARLPREAADLQNPARRGELILDCVMVGEQEWWVGFHKAGGPATRWPGGMLPLELPSDAVSRAWLKIEEALRWSELPIPPGARVAEIGSAPGGASQALLARGYFVLGIDPAEMHPTVAAHPHFTHLRRRSTQVRRREFRKIRWLTADMNVAPNYTLEAVETIVTHPEVKVRGLLLTLKLLKWELAEQLPEYLDRVRSWGFNQVRARQLQHNRREICVAALKKPFLRK